MDYEYGGGFFGKHLFSGAPKCLTPNEPELDILHELAFSSFVLILILFPSLLFPSPSIPPRSLFALTTPSSLYHLIPSRSL